MIGVGRSKFNGMRDGGKLTAQRHGTPCVAYLARVSYLANISILSLMYASTAGSCCVRTKEGLAVDLVDVDRSGTDMFHRSTADTRSCVIEEQAQHVWHEVAAAMVCSAEKD